MIKKGLISAVLAMTCLVTACGSQTAAPQNEAKQTANAQQDVGEQPPQEASDTAVTEQASEAATEQAADGAAEDQTAAPGNAQTGMYEDERGWYVLYEPELFTVESEKDDVK